MRTCSNCSVSKKANHTKSSGFYWRKDRDDYHTECKDCLRAKKRKKSKEPSRRNDTTEKRAIAERPYAFIAVDIIDMAIRDLRQSRHGTKSYKASKDYEMVQTMARKSGHDNVKDALHAFFHSKHFEDLCGAAGGDVDYTRKNILE